MVRFGWFVSVALLVFIASAPARSTDQGGCNNKTPPEIRIPACTAGIEGGRYDGVNLPLAYYLRGNAYMQAGQHEAALADYDTVLRLKPDLSMAYFARGRAHEKLGDAKAALADYDEMMRREPAFAMAYVFKARVLAIGPQAVRDADEAVALARRAIAIEPDATYYDVLAAAYATKGDAAAAMEAYEAAIRLNDGLVPLYQDALTAQGFYKGPSDGRYSDATRAALETCTRARCVVSPH